MSIMQYEPSKTAIAVMKELYLWLNYIHNRQEEVYDTLQYSWNGNEESIYISITNSKKARHEQLEVKGHVISKAWLNFVQEYFIERGIIEKEASDYAIGKVIEREMEMDELEEGGCEQ